MTDADLISVTFAIGIGLFIVCLTGPIMRAGTALFFSLWALSDVFMAYQSYDTYIQGMFACLFIAFAYTMYGFFFYEKPFAEGKIGVNAVFKNLSGVNSIFSYFYMVGVIAGSPSYWTSIFSHQKFRTNTLIAIVTGIALYALPITAYITDQIDAEFAPTFRNLVFYTATLTLISAFLAFYFFKHMVSPPTCETKKFTNFLVLFSLSLYTLPPMLLLIPSFFWMEDRYLTAILSNISSIIFLLISKSYWKISFLRTLGIYVSASLGLTAIALTIFVAFQLIMLSLS